ANEIAAKMAFQYWQQTKPVKSKKNLFLTVREGYHGDTLGSVSLGGIDLFHGIFGPMLFKTLKVKSPHNYPSRNVSPDKWFSDCISDAEKVFKKYGSRLAA